MGYPAKTTDGSTVEIVQKLVGGKFKAANGDIYVRGIGSALFLELETPAEVAVAEVQEVEQADDTVSADVELTEDDDDEDIDL